MKGFCYAAALQFRLDIRSKALFITCYLVPLVFFDDGNGSVYGRTHRPASHFVRTLWQ